MNSGMLLSDLAISSTESALSPGPNVFGGSDIFVRLGVDQPDWRADDPERPSSERARDLSELPWKT